MPNPQPHIATRLLFGVSRFTWRLVVRVAMLVALLVFAVAAGFAAYAVLMLPNVDPWHTIRLKGEFTEHDEDGLDFAGYQAIEAALFEQERKAIAEMPKDAPFYVGSRYDPNGPAMRLAPGQPYNRSTRRTPARVRGAALLIHGLSDGPYSVQKLGDVLFAHGFEVTIIRLPGHGTLPSGMLRMDYDDWVAATHVAALMSRACRRICPSTSPATPPAARSRSRTRWIASRLARTRRCERRHASCCSPRQSNWCLSPPSRASSTSSRWCPSTHSKR
jgi:hypothetical protein